MQLSDAVELINAIPRHSYVEMRGGYEAFCTVLEGDGNEIVTNGGFATDTDWSKTGGWSIGSGVATHSTGSVGTLSQQVTIERHRYYLIEFDMANRTAGSVKIDLAGDYTDSFSTNGTDIQVVYFTTQFSGNLLFLATSDFDGDIDNVSLQLIDSDIDFVKEFYDGSTRKLLAASPDTMYDITSGSPVQLGTSFTNGRWMAAMHNGTMIFVNGDDAPQTYDGSTFTSATISGPATVANLIGCHTHKNRGYYWLKQDQSVWYAAANTLAGALTEFSLGEIAKKGGRLLKMETWTVDGGAGPDDYAVFVMDTGEVIVYAGSDPGTAYNGTNNGFHLVGIYEIGKVINDRAFTKYGGRLLTIASGDLITMPEAFSAASMPATKISNAMTDAIIRYGSNDGWELFVIPDQHLLVINVPVRASPDEFEQYVQNLQTGAFCRFTNINARTWEMYDGSAYFGGSADGTIYKFDSVNADNTIFDIDVVISNAWHDLGMPENKMVTTVRPIMASEGNIEIAVDMAYDFVEPSISSPSSTSSGGTPWGSPWGSPWGTPEGITGAWKTVNGRGSATGLRVKFSRQGDKPKLYKTDALVKPEGNLW